MQLLALAVLVAFTSEAASEESIMFCIEQGTISETLNLFVSCSTRSSTTSKHFKLNAYSVTGDTEAPTNISDQVKKNSSSEVNGSLELICEGKRRR